MESNTNQFLKVRIEFPLPPDSPTWLVETVSETIRRKRGRYVALTSEVIQKTWRLHLQKKTPAEICSELGYCRMSFYKALRIAKETVGKSNAEVSNDK